MKLLQYILATASTKTQLAELKKEKKLKITLKELTKKYEEEKKEQRINFDNSAYAELSKRKEEKRKYKQDTHTYLTFADRAKKLNEERSKKVAMMIKNNYNCYSAKIECNVAEKLEIYVSEKANWNYYAKSYKYPKIEKTINISAPDLKKWELIKGVLTYVVDASTKKCCWIEQEKGLKFKIKQGFILHDNYHAEGKTIEEAEANYRESLKPIKKITKKNKNWITMAEAKKAGNCEAGIVNFLRRYKLQNAYAISKDFLKNIVDLSENNDIRHNILKCL